MEKGRNLDFFRNNIKKGEEDDENAEGISVHSCFAVFMYDDSYPSRIRYGRRDGSRRQRIIGR